MTQLQSVPGQSSSRQQQRAGSSSSRPQDTQPAATRVLPAAIGSSSSKSAADLASSNPMLVVGSDASDGVLLRSRGCYFDHNEPVPQDMLASATAQGMHCFTCVKQGTAVLAWGYGRQGEQAEAMAAASAAVLLRSRGVASVKQQPGSVAFPSPPAAAGQAGSAALKQSDLR